MRSATMTEETKLLDSLKDIHDFPCEFVFKVIGDNAPGFVSKCVQGVINILGPGTEVDVKTRESSKKNHVSVTLKTKVENAENVVRVFSILNQLEGVKFVL